MSTLTSEITRRRTFAIISHPDAGKTTLTEKFLLYGGAIAQAGRSRASGPGPPPPTGWRLSGQRGISVTSSVMQFQHDGFCVNILDTPGHQDFSEDTYRTLMAADSASWSSTGPRAWSPRPGSSVKVCAMRHIPIFTFINKMDRETRTLWSCARRWSGSWASTPTPSTGPSAAARPSRGSTTGRRAGFSCSPGRATAKRPSPPRCTWTTPPRRTSSARPAGGPSGTRWSCWGPAGTSTWRPSGPGS